uniref:Lipoprotein n=1 Tax=Caenorhabditis tropicalis TaxID=1561998 RepID=A0A1I7UWW9_9PELO
MRNIRSLPLRYEPIRSSVPRGKQSYIYLFALFSIICGFWILFYFLVIHDNDDHRTIHEIVHPIDSQNPENVTSTTVEPIFESTTLETLKNKKKKKTPEIFKIMIIKNKNTNFEYPVQTPIIVTKKEVDKLNKAKIPFVVIQDDNLKITKHDIPVTGPNGKPIEVTFME